MGSDQSGPISLCGEEGQEHLALFADQAEEPAGLVLPVGLQIGFAHDDVLDRRIFDTCVRRGDCDAVLIEVNVLDGRITLSQRDQRCGLDRKSVV